jgi:hypothetical protein
VKVLSWGKEKPDKKVAAQAARSRTSNYCFIFTQITISAQLFVYYSDVASVLIRSMRAFICTHRYASARSK